MKDQKKRMTGKEALGHSWTPKLGRTDSDTPGRPESRKVLETRLVLMLSCGVCVVRKMRKFLARHRWKKAIRAVSLDTGKFKYMFSST